MGPSGGKVPRSVVVGPRDLGPQDGLVEVELAVQLLHGGGLGGQVDDRIDALGLLLDLVGETALAPDVDLLDLAAVAGHDLQELVERRLNGALLEVGVEDDHDLVMTHGRRSLLWTDAATVFPWQEVPRVHADVDAGWSSAAGVSLPTSPGRGNQMPSRRRDVSKALDSRRPA